MDVESLEPRNDPPKHPADQGYCDRQPTENNDESSVINQCLRNIEENGREVCEHSREEYRQDTQHSEKPYCRGNNRRGFLVGAYRSMVRDIAIHRLPNAKVQEPEITDQSRKQ